MNERRMIGATAGGLVAGLGLTALLMAGEKKNGKASELTELERASAHQLGVRVPTNGSVPSASEQAIVQGGHLLLSAAAWGRLRRCHRRGQRRGSQWASLRRRFLRRDALDRGTAA